MRWFAVVAVTLVLLTTDVYRPAMAQADGPQFLEKSTLIVPQQEITSTWKLGIEVINPSAQPVQVSVRTVGDLANIVVVSNPNSGLVAPGQAITFTLVAGSRPPAAATGELVVVAPEGVDRRQMVIEAPKKSLVAAYGARALGWLTSAAAVAGAVFLLVRPRRRPKIRNDRGRAASAPAPIISSTVHSDEPTTQDTLDRREYAQALCDTARDSTPPLVIGVFGEWGSGKTSLLLQVKAELQKSADCAVAWFEPWRYQNDPNPVLPLLHAVVNDLGLASLADVERSLSVISQTLGSVVLSATTRVSMTDLRTAIRTYDEENFRVRSERARLDDHFSALIERALEASNRSRLVVFIDDLDRCLPEQILSLLEALKLYLNRSDCVFFLAVDSERLAKAVTHKYGESGLAGADYLDKIVQVPFTMPRITARTFEDYVSSLLTDETRAVLPLIVAGIQRNPRSVRRFINILLIQDTLAKKRGVEPYNVAVLAAILLARWVEPEFYSQLEANPTLLRLVADDLATRSEEVSQWPPVVEQCVTAFRSVDYLGVEMLDDVTAYIDLVAATAPEAPTSSVASEQFSSAASPEVIETGRDISVPPEPQVRKSLSAARYELLSAVQGLLDSALPAPEDRLELKIKLRRDLSELEYRPAIASNDPEFSSDDIASVFDKSGRQLLIVGAPWSGKTVLLMLLADALLQRARADPSAPIPVPIFLRDSQGPDDYFSVLWLTDYFAARTRT